MAPVVHVLLATFNGATYLAQQWDSLEAQEGVELVVHVADDGSSDGTPQLLQQLARQPHGAIRAIHWLRGPPRRSATRSFLQLLAQAVDEQRQAQWFAYCDQDDIWLPHKLATACRALEALQGSVQPALYAGRTLNVDAQDREIGLSPLPCKPPCFRNALAQNVLGGNTMVMNRAGAQLLAAAAGAEVPVHDWFTYLLVTGAGGVAHYDARPGLRYRQHASNLVGGSAGWRARWRRLARTLRGDYARWNAANLAALRACEPVLTEANRAVLRAFEQARCARWPWARMRWLRRSGVFRQRPGEQAMLWLACLLGRI